MLAEIVKHFYPRLVDLHNYIPTCNTDQKLSNWSVLSRKVFHKLRLCISEVDIQKVVANTPGAIEPILCALREKVEDRTAHEDPPGADDPGASSAHADGPWVGLTTHTHAGLPSPSAPSGVKTLWSQMARGACKSQDPAGGPWEHADPRVQQLLEEKEQALALLQESVKAETAATADTADTAEMAETAETASMRGTMMAEQDGAQERPDNELQPVQSRVRGCCTVGCRTLSALRGGGFSPSCGPAALPPVAARASLH
ncbi:sperm flagellar protein 1-like isoform X3 [Equus przewalskii]|uniref:Sperm flagellar protein 1-like isoform X3 n=1 Tax=Equus przewalskii TaxID=9798 RepID=A0ABM4QB42_EQUPR